MDQLYTSYVGGGGGGGGENTNFTSFVFLWAAGFTNVAKDSRHVGVFGAKLAETTV